MVSDVIGLGAARLQNLWSELLLGVSTRGIVDIDHPDSVYYATMPYSDIRKALRLLALQQADVFVDIGSGKGRVLCCAARYQVAKVIGIDLSEPLCTQARANANRLRGRKAPIVVHNVRAQEFDYSRANVFFLFNPFGAETLDQVLTSIRNHTSGHAVRFAYAIPVYAAVFGDHNWLERYAPAGAGKALSDGSVAFFRTRRTHHK
jgi:cyclopropane fatty-acyl-phospholipid synthase-like methyltransferase